MQDLAVQPGRALGPFSLGCTINSVVDYIRRHPKVIKSCELIYSDKV
jgi:hypothetical protein